MSSDSNEAKEELHRAWDEMIGQLELARDCIDVPEKMPAPASDRLLAEGYRYLAGYMHTAVERAFHDDPMRPQFRNALSPITRATIDNADAIYFYTAIDGRQSYLLRGEIGDSRHWRGAAPAATGRKAPHYLIFEASQGALAGDTGELTELIPGTKAQTGRMDSSTIEVGADGSFEILFAPERPSDWQGNFVSTHRRVGKPHPVDPEIGLDRFADYISGRQIFLDWDREDAIHLEIARVGGEGEVSEIYSWQRAAAELRRCGATAHNQIRFWNAFWTILMGTYGERPGTLPGIGFKRNEFNQMNVAGLATGGGMSTNLYAGTIAELEQGEVLLVESEIRARPAYIGFQLGNLWGESLEYANRVGSRNGFQSHIASDGRMRWVIAHEDPGIQNWVDTSGHREVFVAPRWAFSETPAKEDWPTVTCRKIAATELRASLPADTPEFSPEQRRAEIAIRQRHVRRRFRSF
ncbi:MAG: hypothetical protein VCC00_15475 [Deltaproteobacteria bacterium]